MTHCVKLILAAALVAAAFVSRANAETPEEEIRRVIAQLDSESPEQRDRAEALLRDIGPEAALLYRPEDQGKSPEVARRMRALLVDWDFHDLEALPERCRPFRLLPWQPIDKLDEIWIDVLEDDRLPAYYLERAPEIFPLLKRRDLPLDPGAIEVAWKRGVHETLSALQSRGPLEISLESREKLLQLLQEKPSGIADLRAVLLWQLGKPEELYATKMHPWPCRGIENDPRICDAIAKDVFSDMGASELSRRFVCAGFADYYAKVQDFDSLARLGSDVAVPRLKQILKSVEPSARFKVAVLLAGFGVVVPELAGFEDSKNWSAVPWAGDEVARVATLLPGEHAEERLRKIADDSRVDEDARYAALRGLAARKRSRDVTFLYVHLKDLSTDLQPDLAVDLARLGSAAGVGVLVPLLFECDFDLRTSAHKALQTITGQDFGYHPAGTLPERCRAARKWAAWWKANKTSFQPDVK